VVVPRNKVAEFIKYTNGAWSVKIEVVFEAMYSKSRELKGLSIK